MSVIHNLWHFVYFPILHNVMSFDHSFIRTFPFNFFVNSLHNVQFSESFNTEMIYCPNIGCLSLLFRLAVWHCCQIDPAP